MAINQMRTEGKLNPWLQTGIPVNPGITWTLHRKYLRAWRLATIILMILLALCALTLSAYNREMEAAAEELRRANAAMAADRAQFATDRQSQAACLDQIRLLEAR